jgi:hypothetical protein
MPETISPPAIPWQVTGNHWLTLPCIHPVDASIHLAGVVHAGARAAIEFAGSDRYLEGDGPPLIALRVIIDGVEKPIGSERMVWERELAWLPTFSCPVGDLALRGTIFAPYGEKADFAGAVIALSVENRGSAPAAVAVRLEGTLGHRQQRIRSARPFDDRHSLRVASSAIVMEGRGSPGYCAMAVASEAPDAELTATESLDSAARWSVSRKLTLAAGSKEDLAFLLGCGTEPDGAVATLGAMRARGSRALLEATRAALQKLEQATTQRAADKLINRNLLFAYFTGVARAIDDGRIYPVRSRMPWNGRGVTVSDWDALMWLLPAIQLADAELAREFLLRMCELHGHAPGRGVHYIDGALFEPGFSLEGAASYAIAVDEYIVQTGDDRIVEEPALSETLYGASEDLEKRRHETIPLYRTDLNPGGGRPAYRYTAHGNAVAAYALEVYSRTLDEKTAEKVQDAEEVRASALRHFSFEGSDGRARFASSSDLSGNTSTADDPAASLYWLPYYHLVGREDSLYRRTVKQWEASPSDQLVERCARLIGPSGSEALDWLRRAPLDGGVAAELIDESGRATGNGGDAALSGMVAYMAWYAVHALGAKL